MDRTNILTKKTFDEQLVLAREGNVLSQTYVAWSYQNGQGVAKDELEAVVWLTLPQVTGLEIMR